jgi:hypothetical protein
VPVGDDDELTTPPVHPTELERETWVQAVQLSRQLVEYPVLVVLEVKKFVSTEA